MTASLVDRVETSRLTAVRLASLATAVPPLRVTQQEALAFVLARFPVKESTKVLYRRVFENASVRTRHFALDSLEQVLDADRDAVNRRFEKKAVELAARALRGALREAGLVPADLDALTVTTCTGYLCPGLGAYVAEACGLRRDVFLSDLVGMGCGAAVPALRDASQFVQTHPGARAAAVSVEICSAAMFSDDAADLVVSNALFADGAAAAVLEPADRPSPGKRGEGPRLRGFASLLRPEWRDKLRFRTDGGRLRNVLAKDVPERAAEALRELVDRLLAEHGLAASDVGHWLFHSGGGKILDALQSGLSLPPAALESSRRVLRDFGNMSSPTVLFVLQDRLAAGDRASEKGREGAAAVRPGDLGVLASFGAGFSAHAALLEF